MPTTTITPLIHSPEEHAIVVMPSAGSVENIAAVQQRLGSILGDAIWLSPPHALHMTLMEIICNTEYTGLTRKQHFTKWYDQYNTAAKETIAQFPSFHITFNELVVSPAAIIIKAADPMPFNAIRAELLANTKLPAQTKMPPDIAHCTIARYNKEVDLDTVVEQVKAIAVNFDEHITEFRLMKDLGPDFNPILIETYSLAK